ncbi:hypothetical protein KTQ42_08990|uniref:hypothetical protein n=1 Tax=Noviherbaspirillum sp. L7-7A TaxID=2850560 RepID=UPI001C2BABA3|nr:hypothetical protein [Noviherbaspirillum sp. L7-7A]MBV0879436.1 hypothetical protein [Noviherbaspirillum sp. L7-7A]
MRISIISVSKQWACTALITVGVLSGVAGASQAADQNATIEKERTDCMSGNSQQDRATCMREAGAAKQESQRGKLRDSGDYQTNASKRCDSLPAAEKADCERRANGEGSVSGSVGSGGVVRELVTPVPSGQSGSK